MEWATLATLHPGQFAAELGHGADAIVLVALGRDLDQQLTKTAEDVVPLLVR